MVSWGNAPRGRMPSLVWGHSFFCLKEARKLKRTVDCWICGKDVDYDYESNFKNAKVDKQVFYTPDEQEEILDNTGQCARTYCADCGTTVQEEYQADLAEYIRLKSKLMVNRAITNLERQILDIYDYQAAIEVVSEFGANNPEKFMSSQEVIAAIILVHNEIKATVQYKILNYQVDFYLPTLKVVLEIDGFMHDYSEVKDSRRDINIRDELGADWEVIRIPTKYIDENAKVLPEAIIETKKYKQKLRRQNHGVIPDWYSKREQKNYKRILGKHAETTKTVSVIQGFR
jgi:very-short-patch-repair endonuclease